MHSLKLLHCLAEMKAKIIEANDTLHLYHALHRLWPIKGHVHFFIFWTIFTAHALGQYYDTGEDDTTPNWMKPVDAYAGKDDWNKEYSNWNEQVRFYIGNIRSCKNMTNLTMRSLLNLLWRNWLLLTSYLVDWQSRYDFRCWKRHENPYPHPQKISYYLSDI